MTQIIGTLTDVGATPGPGTLRIAAVDVRPDAAGQRTITTQWHSYPIDAKGQFRIPDAVPGPAQIVIESTDISERIKVVIPQTADPVRLETLLPDDYEWPAPVVGEAQQAVRDAIAQATKATQAATQADNSAERAGESAVSAASSAESAGRDASAAGRDAAAAAASAGEAAVSAGEAKGAAGDAASAAASAQAAKTSEQAAKQAESGARDSEQTASEQAGVATQGAQTATGQAEIAAEQADRAASEADRSKTEADRAASEAGASSVKAVAEKVDELLAGAPEAYDTLLEIAEELERGQSAEAALVKEIAGKAPLDHAHTFDDVTGLQAALDGKTNTATVNSVSSRVTTLENSAPIIVSSLPPSPLPGRIYLVTE